MFDMLLMVALAMGIPKRVTGAQWLPASLTFLSVRHTFASEHAHTCKASCVVRVRAVLNEYVPCSPRFRLTGVRTVQFLRKSTGI
jgi:hypothetical protein